MKLKSDCKAILCIGTNFSELFYNSKDNGLSIGIKDFLKRLDLEVRIKGILNLMMRKQLLQACLKIKMGFT